MDERTKRTRAGTVVALVGLLMLVIWTTAVTQVAPWEISEGIRLFLVAVGAAFLLAGVLVARSRPPAGPPA